MFRVLALFALLCLPGSASADPASIADEGPSIAKATEGVEIGHFVTVEGQVTDVTRGNGSWVVATLEDDSGKVLIAVPEYVRRNFPIEPGQDATHMRIRVFGKWDRAPLDHDKQGVRVQKIEKLSD